MIGCCYWRRLAKRHGHGHGLDISDRKRIGVPKPLMEQDPFSRKGGVGGPMSSTVSATSTLVAVDDDHMAQVPPRLTEFWNGCSPASSSTGSKNKTAKFSKKGQSPPLPSLQLQRINNPSTTKSGGATAAAVTVSSALHITSPIESIPPRRPQAPGQDPWSSSSFRSYSPPTSPTSDAYFNNNSAPSVISSTTGRSKRMPAHLPTPLSHKQGGGSGGRRGSNQSENTCFYHQGGSSGPNSPREDENEDDGQWLMMTVPSAQQVQQDHRLPHPHQQAHQYQPYRQDQQPSQWQNHGQSH